jgi:hypothetical protein
VEACELSGTIKLKNPLQIRIHVGYLPLQEKENARGNCPLICVPRSTRVIPTPPATACSRRRHRAREIAYTKPGVDGALHQHPAVLDDQRGTTHGQFCRAAALTGSFSDCVQKIGLSRCHCGLE